MPQLRAVRWSREDFYAAPDKPEFLAASLGAPRLMSWPPDRGSARSLAQSLRSRGCRGAVSVGCGTGVIEWLLSEFLPVRAVDLWRPTDPWCELVPELSPGAYECVLDPVSRNIELADVAPAEALAFFWPMPCCMCTRYAREYRGPCIVVGPAQIEGEEAHRFARELSGSGWTVSENYEWPGKRPTTVAVFVRQQPQKGEPSPGESPQ
eukprot:m51a1_g13777 hypothetical protein (208) ;mRNA; f:289208-289831